ncbi:hypothetical protein IW262DRAFT_1301561 [Armillaria fumosa]|nr:hypothetical protein IW262DRAFT_1301561 [Armillaria fumosa]
MELNLDSSLVNRLWCHSLPIVTAWRVLSEASHESSPRYSFSFGPHFVPPHIHRQVPPYNLGDRYTLLIAWMRMSTGLGTSRPVLPSVIWPYYEETLEGTPAYRTVSYGRYSLLDPVASSRKLLTRWLVQLRRPALVTEPFILNVVGATSVVIILEIIQRITFSEYLRGVSGTKLLAKLNSERRSHGIRRILKAKKISDDISAYRQRVQAIKEDFLIRTTTTTLQVLSDVQDQFNMRLSALAGAVEASEKNITSTMKDNIEEMRTSGDETMEKVQLTLRDLVQRGLHKGLVRDLIPGDIYLEASIPRSCHNGSRSGFDEYHAIIDDRPKLVRIFRAQADQQERMMKLFGLCTSSNFADEGAVMDMLEGRALKSAVIGIRMGCELRADTLSRVDGLRKHRM